MGREHAQQCTNIKGEDGATKASTWVVILGCVLLPLLLISPTLAAAACPNEAVRNGPSANLPDCRAYEMVTPPEKEDRIQGNGDVATTPTFLGASADGLHILLDASVPLPGSQTGQQDTREETRTPAGWTSVSVERRMSKLMPFARPFLRGWVM